MKRRILLDKNWEISEADKNEWMPAPDMPMGVHEILHAHKKINDDFLIGLGNDSMWVAETDRVYSCVFSAPAADDRAFLRFGMLDTIAKLR